MSGWRILVQDLAGQSEPAALTGRHDDIRVALSLGLIEACGRRKDGPTPRPILYRVTEAGRLFAEGKVRAEGRQTGKAGRPELRLAATWLRALPTVTESQWSGPKPREYTLESPSKWGGL